jgi:hypothetical protein
VICGEHINSGGALYADSRYYQVYGTEQKGKFWYRHNSFLILSVLMGSVLILSGFYLRDKSETEE